MTLGWSMVTEPWKTASLFKPRLDLTQHCWESPCLMLLVLSSKPSVPFKEQLDELDLRGRENTVFILVSHYFFVVSFTILGNFLFCNISAVLRTIQMYMSLNTLLWDFVALIQETLIFLTLFGTLRYYFLFQIKQHSCKGRNMLQPICLFYA